MKAFISHNSAQKDFAERIAEQIGYDQCIIDKHDFSPAYRTMDEIIEKIDSSIIFVFLISRESIESPWCKNEVRLARQRVREGKLELFLPYIIDSEIDLEMIKCKFEWIVSEETYNLKLFRSPVMVARDIELKIRQIERRKNNVIRALDEIFEGRNEQINEFQAKKSKKRKAKSLIISGRSGTGRHRFSQRCADDIGYCGKYFFESVDLPDSGMLSDLIVQLNPITCLYSQEQLTDILRSDETRQLDAAVELLNEIYRYQGRIRINDINVIVDYKSDLNGWFAKLLGHPNLKEILGIFLISSSHMRASYESGNPNIIAIRMPELSKTDREIILTRYLSYFSNGNNTEEDYTDEDIGFFVDKLRQSPSQLVEIAEIIARSGVGEAKRSVENIRCEGDNRISELLKSFVDNDVAINFLTLLAHTGMMSYEDIKGVYNDEYSKLQPILEDLIVHSIVYETGVSSSILRIDTAIGDYLIRIKKTIPSKIKQCLQSYLHTTVDNAASLVESPSLYMMRCKQALEDNRFNLENLLLPSIAMNHLISLYHSGDSYERVIAFAHQLLDNDLPISLDEELKQEILFWECLALAHIRNREEFYNRVQGINDRSNQCFLKGFFKNRSEDYIGAIRDFETALKFNPSMNKAKREIVFSYIHMKQYDDALKYAKENYEGAPDNSYHITAYFQCLLFKKGRTKQDEVIMGQLIERVRDSFLPDKEEVEAGMTLLWKVRIPGYDRTLLYDEVREIQNKYPGHKYIQDVASSCFGYLDR